MNATNKETHTGIVYIVGAGPGDRKLITLKGVECLQKADVVIYDLLLNNDLLNYCPAHTEKIQAPDPRIRTTRQAELNQLLIQHAKAGKNVVRLKGGDPYVFGRGGEEAMELVKAGIPFEIVPGITSGIASTAYAGIPVTHRDYASSVAFVTGHSTAIHPDSNIKWNYLATAVDTLVVYMGVAHLQQIVDLLIEHGRDARTLVSLVRVGTTPQQLVVQGTLTDIVEKVETAKLTSPALIVVGEVNHLREQLRWFDNKPLFGKRILVTRARAQASDFSGMLEENGAEVIQFPTIAIKKLDETVIPSPENYHWIVFTSVNAVEIYYENILKKGKDARTFGGVKICAVGPKTVDALNRIGIRPDFVPSHASGKIVATELNDVDGKRILLPRAKIASPELPNILEKRGAYVDDMPLYDTVKVASENTNAVETDLLDGNIDIVTFTSSSTVTNFLEMFPTQTAKDLLANVRIAVIGPTTEATAKKHCINVNIVSQETTIESLTEAIVESYSKP